MFQTVRNYFYFACIPVFRAPLDNEAAYLHRREVFFALRDSLKLEEELQNSYAIAKNENLCESELSATQDQQLRRKKGFAV